MTTCLCPGPLLIPALALTHSVHFKDDRGSRIKISSCQTCGRMVKKWGLVTGAKLKILMIAHSII
jgi:hypothetical protein